MARKPRAYVAYEDTPRIPERKRSPRAKAESIARRQARALKVEVAR